MTYKFALKPLFCRNNIKSLNALSYFSLYNDKSRSSSRSVREVEAAECKFMLLFYCPLGSKSVN